MNVATHSAVKPVTGLAGSVRPSVLGDQADRVVLL